MPAFIEDWLNRWISEWIHRKGYFGCFHGVTSSFEGDSHRFDQGPQTPGKIVMIWANLGFWGPRTVLGVQLGILVLSVFSLWLWVLVSMCGHGEQALFEWGSESLMKHKAHRTNLCHCSFCCTEMCLVGTLWGWELEGKEGCPSEVFFFHTEVMRCNDLEGRQRFIHIQGD